MNDVRREPVRFSAIVGGVLAREARIAEVARATDTVICRTCKRTIRKADIPREYHPEIFFQTGMDQQPHQTGICGECGRSARVKKVVDSLPAYMAKEAEVPARYTAVPPAPERYGAGSWFITGNVGTGKTWLACQIIARRLIVLGQALFVSAPEMVVSIQSLPIEKRDGYQREIARFAGLLVLDDLAAEKFTDYVRQVYYVIINRRSMDMLDTVITTNLGLDELDAVIGQRLVSRIVEQYRIIRLSGPDRRIEGTANGRRAK